MDPQAASSRKLFPQKQLLQFLSSLQPQVLAELFKGDWSEFACQAVFRALAPQARTYVLKGLGGEFVTEQNLSWKGNARVHEAAVEGLRGLGIFQLRDASKLSTGPGNPAQRRKGPVYQMSESFLEGLKQALVNTTLNISDAQAQGNNKRKDKVEENAAEKWNAVLSFLVSSSGGILGSSNGTGEESSRKRPTKKARMSTTSPTFETNLDSTVQNSLKILGFYSETEENGQQITSSGYEFMLKEVYEQVFLLVQHFVDTLPISSRAPTLRFLFFLSFLKQGHEFELKSSQLPSDVVSYFQALGLIHHLTGNKYAVSSIGAHAIFAPSSQKKLLSLSKTEEGQDQHRPQQKMFGLGGMRIIVETTFKVFCYTTSPMHAQMLQLFCQVEARLPNLVVAVITRESVSEAFKKGISDEQLISFLQQNAHPMTYESRFNIVPDNVTDQIRLWKRELNRIELSYGRLFVMEKQNKIYDKVVAQQALEPFLPWRDDKGKKLFVTNEGFQMFKDACNKARQELLSNQTS